MLVILWRLSAGAFLFILLPAKHLTTHKDHESPLQTPSVLGWENSPPAAWCLAGTASYSWSNTSINLYLMTFWHSNQFIRCSFCKTSPARPGQGARPLLMHNAWDQCIAQYLWQTDTSATLRLHVPNGPGSRVICTDALRATLLCFQLAVLGEAGQCKEKGLGLRNIQKTVLSAGKVRYINSFARGLREACVPLIQADLWQTWHLEFHYYPATT